MFHPQGPTLRELATQALSSTERGYDLLAPKFDYTPFRTPDTVLRPAFEALEPLSPFDSGLDLCCGTGAALGLLRPLCRTCAVGLDVSQGMLEVGRLRQAGSTGPAPIHWTRGDALALPFPDASFDVVVSFGAFGHFLEQEHERLLGEVARVLCPGGRFAFVAAAMPPPWSARYWLGRSFNAAIHVRNRLVQPPFVMYYLTFVLPDVQRALERQGLDTEVTSLPGPLGRRGYRLVSASRPRRPPPPGPARSP
jgi:ubiquinone/menaquinone biosynthesis C-methylase UbiE